MNAPADPSSPPPSVRGSPALVRLWRCRWCALRLLIALALLWALWAEGDRRAMRLALAAMPDHDFAAEAARLRDMGHFSEAVTTAEAGLALLAPLDDNDPRSAALSRQRDLARNAQESWLRRVRDVGLGALTGPGGGQGGLSDNPDDYTTLERLGGALVADLFVLGDVRDLVIQSIRASRGQEVDPVIIALSAVGLATTVAPESDWVPSVLKSARRLGALPRKISDAIIDAARARNADALRALFTDVRALATAASPAGAVKLLPLAEDAKDLSRLARFAAKTGPAGAKALELGGPSAVRLLRDAEAAGAAVGGGGGIAGAARAERLIQSAARKGAPGRAWLESIASGSTRSARAMLRPHPLVGLVKGFYKGEVGALLERSLRAFDVQAWWILGALAAWATLESGLIFTRLSR